MYSVLIQNEKTIESFNEFYPLFLNALNDGEIGYCRWIESGRTIDTALPGLSELTVDKKEWRAIIVRVEDEMSMSEFKASPDNPYDFEVMGTEWEKSDAVEDAPVPLIRLTHMLGGIPTPELDFEKEVVESEGMAPIMVFKPNHNKEKEDRYKALQKMYKYDGILPKDIIVITFHEEAGEDTRKQAENLWAIKDELRSSEFWKRNNYPGPCRFLKYEYKLEGRVRKTADLFNFWTSVYMLCHNTIDPSSLQAYRLYRIRTEIDNEALTENFQRKADDLRGSKLYITNEIQRDIEAQANHKNPDPIFKMDIPVHMELPKSMDVEVATDKFGLCPKSINIELKKWDNLRDDVEDTVTDVYKKSDRALGESAERMRLSQELTELEVTPLDKYGLRDLDEQLDNIFDEILTTQNTLSASRSRNRKESEEKASLVREKLVTRVDKMVAFEIAFLIAIIAVFCCIPAFVFSKISGLGAWYVTLAFMGGIVLILMIAEIIILFIQRQILVGRIEQYNDAMYEELTDLTNDLSMFSHFVSNIVSYARGCSFKDVLTKRKFSTKEEHVVLTRHMHAINILLEKLERWSKAYYLNVKFSGEATERFAIDGDISPKNNTFYSLAEDKEYEIPLNESGDVVYSQFEFVTRLRIEREELFEDAGAAD